MGSSPVAAQREPVWGTCYALYDRQVTEICLDAGTGALGNTSRRQMSQDSGTDRMDYDRYQDPGRTVHWGDKSGSDTVEVETTGAVMTVPVYGRIASGQKVRDGTYNDVITVQVHY